MILLQLTASTGPEECCLAVRKTLAVVLRECEEKSVRAEILKQVPGGQPGIFARYFWPWMGPEPSP